MDAKLEIEIKHDATDTSMGFSDSDDHEQYNFTASLAKFEAMVVAEMKRRYPGAEVSIEGDETGRTRVWTNADDMQEHDEIAETVDIVIGSIFEDFAWLVAK